MKTEWREHQGKRLRVLLSPHVCPQHKVELVALLSDPSRDICPICDRVAIEAAITEHGEDNPAATSAAPESATEVQEPDTDDSAAPDPSTEPEAESGQVDAAEPTTSRRRTRQRF